MALFYKMNGQVKSTSNYVLPDDELQQNCRKIFAAIFPFFHFTFLFVPGIPMRLCGSWNRQVWATTSRLTRQQTDWVSPFPKAVRVALDTLMSKEAHL